MSKQTDNESKMKEAMRAVLQASPNGLGPEEFFIRAGLVAGLEPAEVADAIVQFQRDFGDDAVIEAGENFRPGVRIAGKHTAFAA